METLKQKDRWVCWKLVGDKKIPYSPRLPLVEAKVNDESSWGTHDEALAMIAAGHVDGKGYVLGDGEAGIDIDDCRNPETGVLTPEAQRIISDTNSYTEISPSKCGIKIFVKAWLGKNHVRKGLEIYGHKRYFTVTEDHFEGSPTDVEARASEIEALIAREFEFDTADEVPDDDLPIAEDVPDSLEDETEIIDANRNVTLTRIGGSLRRLGFDDDELLATLLVLDQKRCKPAMGEHEVSVIARSLGKYPPNKAERKIDWMNERHAIVFEAGKTVIFTERKEEQLDRFVYDRSSAHDIRLLYANHPVDLGKPKGAKKKIIKDLGDYWLTHPGRKQYSGVVFDPDNTINDASKLNLWRGFRVQPKPGDWSLFRDHLQHVVCRNDPHVFDFVLKWLARLFQKPGRPAETAIAMRGRQGIGKGIVGRVVGSILGQHYLPVTHAHHLVGHFNAHLQDAVFVFADEAVAPQDKAAISALKALVTEPLVTIERKGKDSYTARNVIHLIMASNHDWVLPAELDERRWVMLDVDPAHANDHRYFAALLKQMKDGGREAMLHDLLALDLNGWNHRDIPHTKALFEQKLASMSPLHKWWFGKLWVGRLLSGDDEWMGFVASDAIYADLITELDRTGVHRRPTETEFGMQWRKLLPDVPGGSLIRKRGAKPKGGQTRPWVYVLPLSVDAYRKAFEAASKQEIPWPDGEGQGKQENFDWPKEEKRERAA
jgi:hypothetical protein